MRNLQRRKPNRLWIARQKAGLGQKNVARLLGHTTVAALSEYENGRVFPKLETVLRLAAIYQTPVEELYAPVYKEIQEEVDERREKMPFIIPNFVHRPPPMPMH